MWDCMIQEGCIFVKETFNVTLLDTNTSTLVWAGTYLDSIADASTINAAPSGVLVSACCQGLLQSESGTHVR